MPQTHEPGVEADVDFGDVWLHLDGERTKERPFKIALARLSSVLSSRSRFTGLSGREKDPQEYVEQKG